MTTAFVIAAAGYAWVATMDHGRVQATSESADSGAEDTRIGEDLFKARCQRCHDIDEAQELLPLSEPGNGIEPLDRLNRHRKADAVENQAILNFLQRQGPIAPDGM